MKGLVIWAQSDCRSTMGLYDAIIKHVDVPVVVALWFFRKGEGQIDNRMEVGFRADEFSHIKMINVGENWTAGEKILFEHPGYDHIFAVYQNSKVWRKFIAEAKGRGGRVIVASESPCNMYSGYKYLLKELYLRIVLPQKVKSVVRDADMFFNLSGDDDKYAKILGWRKDKIIPFGYFPPPIPGSTFVQRTDNAPFRILSTGVLSKYRGADILVEALQILKERGVDYEATITQDGELAKPIKERAQKFRLPIRFPGFLPMAELIRLYETCTVYVGAGRHEPWGMRLNDALNCGAPLIVSRGMGGVKMIDDYGCGLAFQNGSAVDLADKLELLASSSEDYEQIVRGVSVAARKCSPISKAKEIIDMLRKRGYGL